MKILVIGKEGQLGTSIYEESKKENLAGYHFTTMSDLDVSCEKSIRRIFEENNYQYVVNCSAYTAVDKAESDPDMATVINGLAPGWIGKHAALTNARVIHVSTDYVFDGSGNNPLTPEMTTNPLSVYGTTKLEGEKRLLSENHKSIVIRTSWLYSPHGQNFVKTMLRLGREKKEINVIYDQVGTPTSAIDLAKAIIAIITRSTVNNECFQPGIYHYSNEGVCSWYDFAMMIFKLSSTPCKVNPILSDAYPTIATRPKFSVLDKSKIKSQFGLEIPHWLESLEEVIAKLMNGKAG